MKLSSIFFKIFVCVHFFAIYLQEYQIYTMIMEQLQETVPMTAAELVKVDKDLGLTVGKYNLWDSTSYIYTYIYL